MLPDHKPLLGMFEEKLVPIVAPPRIIRWALLLSEYELHLAYSPGKQHLHCDALSRLPLRDMPRLSRYQPRLFIWWTLWKMVLCRLHRSESGQNVMLLCLLFSDTFGMVGQQIHRACQWRWRINELSIHEDCIMWGNRVEIPPQGREAIQGQLREGHLGASRMKSRCRSYFWWPGVDRDIENTEKQCLVCQEQKPAVLPSELRLWTWPQKPWCRLHLDYCGPFEGRMWLLITDAHSKWLDVYKASSPSAQVTMEKCRQSIASFGVPETIVTDNAACFICQEFQSFF